MVAEPPRIIICGDVHHPGGEGGVFARFIETLAWSKPARLVILGDLFEHWTEDRRAVQHHCEVLGFYGP